MRLYLPSPAVPSTFQPLILQVEPNPCHCYYRCWVLCLAATTLSSLLSTAGSLFSSFLSAHLTLTFHLTLESCSETIMVSVLLKFWQYIHTTLWFCSTWMLEDCKVAKGTGYWLVSFGALCLWIREILFWTWILVRWMWILSTNSLPPYSTVLYHSGTLC